MLNKGQNLQPSPAIDVSIWVKHSRVGRETTKKPTIKYSCINSNSSVIHARDSGEILFRKATYLIYVLLGVSYQRFDHVLNFHRFY